MTVFIKGVKIQTPIDQNTYRRLISEPYVHVTRFNQNMCSYSNRYKRKRNDINDVYGPNFEDEESYYRYMNEQNNYQGGYTVFSNNNSSYGCNFGAGTNNYYPAGFPAPLTQRRPVPYYPRYNPYRCQSRQSYRGRQRGHTTFSVPRRPPPKRYPIQSETAPPEPTEKLVPSAKDDNSKNSEGHSEKSAVQSEPSTKESSVSDDLCSNDKPEETTAQFSEVPEVKSENTTIYIDTECCETPPREHIVGSTEEIVQTTGSDPCDGAIVKEELQPTATSTPLYEPMSSVNEQPLQPKEMPFKDFVIDVRASFFSKTTSPQRIEKRKVVDGECTTVEPKLPKLDDSSTKIRSSKRLKGNHNQVFKEIVPKIDEVLSKLLTESRSDNIVHKKLKTEDREPKNEVKSSAKNKIRVLENVVVNKSTSTRQDQEKKLTSTDAETTKKSKQTDINHKKQILIKGELSSKSAHLQNEKKHSTKSKPFVLLEKPAVPLKPQNASLSATKNKQSKKLHLQKVALHRQEVKSRNDNTSDSILHDKSNKKQKNPMVIMQPLNDKNLFKNQDVTSVLVEKPTAEESNAIKDNIKKKELPLNRRERFYPRVLNRNENTNKITKKQKDPVVVKKSSSINVPKKQDVAKVLLNKPATPSEQQKTFVDELNAINNMEMKRLRVKKPLLHRRESFDVGVLNRASLHNENTDKSVKLHKQKSSVAVKESSNDRNDSKKAENINNVIEKPATVSEQQQKPPSAEERSVISNVNTKKPYRRGSADAGISSHGSLQKENTDEISRLKKLTQHNNLTKKLKVPVAEERNALNNMEKKKLCSKIISLHRRESADTEILNYLSLRNKNTIEDDKKLNLPDKLNSIQTAPVAIEEPAKCDTNMLVEKPPTSPEQQKTSSITAEEMSSRNNMEKKKPYAEKAALYRRKSVDVGALYNRKEVSVVLRKRRAKSVGPVTDAGDFFTGFRLTRSKSQELGATLCTDIVNYNREHKKLNLQDAKSALLRNVSDCDQHRYFATSESFKLINISGSLINDPRLTKHSDPQFLTKEKFMESLNQSFKFTGVKDYRFNFEKPQTHNYDKIKYVNMQPTSLLISPLHDHLSFAIESSSKSPASGGDDKNPRGESLKAVINDQKNSCPIKRVVDLNPASPPITTKAPQMKYPKFQPPKTSKKLFHLPSPSKASGANKDKKPTTFTNTNPITKQKKRGRKKKNSDLKDVIIPKAPRSPLKLKLNIKNLNKIRITTSKTVGRPLKKNNHLKPPRDIKPRQGAPNLANVPITTSTILKDCLLHENIDKFFPSNTVNDTCMVLNAGDVSVLMTEKGCKKISHELIETVADEKWQEVEEFLTPKSFKANSSASKGATEEADVEMLLHEVIQPENTITVKRSTPVPIVPKPTMGTENSFGFQHMTLTVTPNGSGSENPTISKAESGSSLETVTPTPPKTSVIVGNIIEKQPVSMSTASNTTAVAKNGFMFPNITITPIKLIPNVVAENSSGFENTSAPAVSENSCRSENTNEVSLLPKPRVVTNKDFDYDSITIKSILPKTITTKSSPVPVSVVPQSVPENVVEKKTLPVLIPSSSAIENLTEKQTVPVPAVSNPTRGSFGVQQIPQNSNMPQAVITQIGCSEPLVNFSVALPPVAPQLPLKRISHRNIAKNLLPIIYRLVIYKQERNTFRTVRGKMNQNIVAKEILFEDFKILSDAYTSTIKNIGSEMINYLKGVHIKTFHMVAFLKETENLFAKNGLSSITEQTVLICIHDAFLHCLPINESGFLSIFWKDVQKFMTHLINLRISQAPANVPSQTAHGQRSRVNHYQNKNVLLNSNSATTINNNLNQTFAPTYPQNSDVPRNNTYQRPSPIHGQSGGYTTHHYPSNNQFGTQNPNSNYIHSITNQFVSQNNSNQKQLSSSQQQNQNVANKQPQPSYNYNYLQIPNVLPGQERPNLQQHAAVSNYSQSIPSSSSSSSIQYTNSYDNQRQQNVPSVMYNPMYQDSRLGTAQLQNVRLYNQHGNIPSYENHARHNIVNNYNKNQSAQKNPVQILSEIVLGRQLDSSACPPQNTILPPYYQNTVYPPSVLQAQNTSKQNTANNIYHNPENRSMSSDVSHLTRNHHQTWYPPHNPLPTQHVIQNVSVAPPLQTTMNPTINSEQLTTPQRPPHYSLSDLLRSNQFPIPPTTVNDIIEKENVPKSSSRNDDSNKEPAVEQRQHQLTSVPNTVEKNPPEKDIPSQPPADNFKIYLPSRPPSNTTQPENAASSEKEPVDVQTTPSNKDDATNLEKSDDTDVVEINDSDEEVEPEYVSFETWASKNQEVVDLDDYDDIFEVKYIVDQSIKNEMKTEIREECEIVEEFPPSVASPDSGICTPKEDEINICFCGSKAGFICSCRSAIYCSRRCQEVDWDSHRKDCKSQNN